MEKLGKVRFFVLAGVVCISAFIIYDSFKGYMGKLEEAKAAEQNASVKYASEDDYDAVVAQVKEGTVAQAIVTCKRYDEKEVLVKINRDGLKIVGSVVWDGCTRGFIVEKAG